MNPLEGLLILRSEMNFSSNYTLLFGKTLSSLNHIKLGNLSTNGFTNGYRRKFSQMPTNIPKTPMARILDSINWRYVSYFIGGLAVLSGCVGLYYGVTYAQETKRAKSRPIIPGLPIVYFDVFDGDEFLGKVIIQLRSDVVPKTAENFLQLCTHKNGYGYRASPFFKVDFRKRIFGGDFFGAGTGNYSIYGDSFDCEDFSLPHDGIGTVAMVTFGNNQNGSQFYITERALPELNGKNVVVGYVVDGFEAIEAIARGSLSSGYFTANSDFRIMNCGQLENYTKKPQL